MINKSYGVHPNHLVTLESHRAPVFASLCPVSLSQSLLAIRVTCLAAEQLTWQAQELGVLIHFNMATYLDVDGCSGQKVPDVSLFNPYQLNTDNWAQTMVDFGAQYAVLVAKVSGVRRTSREKRRICSAWLWISHGPHRGDLSSQSIRSNGSLQLFHRLLAGQGFGRSQAVRRQLSKTTDQNRILLHRGGQCLAERREWIGKSLLFLC